ncbi:MAG TPA: hypothetical protein ENI73_07585 [Spirochaetes bacterium]|nr:hypothetical protein [Spirochaetota bacterium]
MNKLIILIDKKHGTLMRYICIIRRDVKKRIFPQFYTIYWVFYENHFNTFLTISDPLYYDGFFHVAWYSSEKNGIVITLWNPKSNERKDIFIKRPFAYQQFSIGRMANSLLIAWHESKRGKSKSSIHTRLIKLD